MISRHKDGKEKVRVDEEDEIYLHRKYQHLHTFRLPNEIFQQSSSSFRGREMAAAPKKKELKC